jgi:hypothetical protein
MTTLRRGNVYWGGGGVGPELGDHRAVGRDPLCEVGVLRRVDATNPGAEDGDGAAAGGEAGLMRRSIDAASETGEQTSQLLGAGQAPRAGPKGADHGHRVGVVGAQLTAIEKERRQVVDQPQVGRVVGIEDGGQANAIGVGLLHEAGDGLAMLG